MAKLNGLGMIVCRNEKTGVLPC